MFSKQSVLLIACTFVCFSIFGQGHGFEFGEFNYDDLRMKVYDKDTSARAVVLDEFGEAYFDNYNDHNLIFEYHVKIKVLKSNGLSLADFQIPLQKFNGKAETIRSIDAVSYWLENGSKKEQRLEQRNIFTEKRSENLEIKKIPIPNVRVGSVFEIAYELESPFIFNFRTWIFQWDIPKMRSEYWALIPANYNYNISLKGYLKLSKNEIELVKDWFAPGGGMKADCTLMKCAIENIPAFIEEDYMTASHNFISSINFELSEIKFFDGHVDKITAEWKDVEQELRNESRFGIQLRRGKDLGEAVEALITGETDSLVRAKKIYDFIKSKFKWNEEDSKYCENGIKKAFDSGTGNVGDINLSLIAALRFGGLAADPLILSTRENGFVSELYPVLSDFNYVLARLTVKGRVYLLDATDPFLPFGMIPVRCLNGKGRVISDKESYWHPIDPPDKMKETNYVALKLGADGVFRGTIQNTYFGYKAVARRKKILSHPSTSDYIQEMDKATEKISIKKIEFENIENLNEPLTEKWEVEVEGLEGSLSQPTLLINPYLINKWEENPFKSTERLYPVDFAAPIDYVMTFSLEYPPDLIMEDLPKNSMLALPNAGGRFYLSAINLENKLSITSRLIISRTIYTSNEYHSLKELFNRILQLQQADIVFRKK